MKPIADTGLIVALLAADDPAHAWAAESFRRHSPFYVCDAVLAEACSFFPHPRPVLTLVARRDLILDFDLAEGTAPRAGARNEIRRSADGPG